MKTITTELFQLNELNDSAKEIARQWWRKCDEGDSYWSESTIEEFQQQAEFMGFTFKTRDIPLRNGKTRQEPCIRWSGFYSQGDGACFEGEWTASDMKVDKVAEGWGDAPETTEIKRIATELAGIAKEHPDAFMLITHSGRYYHENSVSFNAITDRPDEDGDVVYDEATENALKSAAQDLMRYLYSRLKADYEYHNSDESVDESIVCNEYWFTAEGERMD